MTLAIKQLSKAARIILIGAPGVGKGTQTERLLAKFPQLASISSGDLLRENVRKKSPLGLKAETAMQAGNLVPDSLILELISSEFKSKGWLSTSSSSSIASNASFILDGFPRTAAQASSLETLVPINFVVQLVTPPSVILSRIASRWVHEPSGRVYNTDFNAPKVPGKDDITGEPLTQREDDSIDTWKQRLRKFEETSEPLLQHYERKGCLWRVEGNTSDEISPQLFAEVEKRFC
ncbi:adenylate kinase-domain-containing protein [Aspergillus pseudotamarii]|uniref:GTP:AMP phosphotransferase, mitochondrial n=2 Tax=Aspergillus subgen. Circumdati TaxID=2720871 RepID=A0A5N7A950_9EURO|nr:adenylate kinase-domain-containing protein [Aspergillus pseudotamarii]XP_031928191.1 adenylate kinase-domain-containing protein [Aspergillus caelatus]KAE8134564.1 adenylate kinase-domain-containing protein [Aspergillus pseudotamarii]KAE8365110.1 adenylate kinase-domain-containing protein [Aspergillus caelatus]